MTMEERVIKGLTCCVTKEHCHYGEDGCPWYFPENPEDCTSRLARAANGLIQFYKREIAEKTQENTFLKQMQRQNDHDHKPDPAGGRPLVAARPVGQDIQNRLQGNECRDPVFLKNLSV